MVGHITFVIFLLAHIFLLFLTYSILIRSSYAFLENPIQILYKLYKNPKYRMLLLEKTYPSVDRISLSSIFYFRYITHSVVEQSKPHNYVLICQQIYCHHKKPPKLLTRQSYLENHLIQCSQFVVTSDCNQSALLDNIVKHRQKQNINISYLASSLSSYRFSRNVASTSCKNRLVFILL